MSRPCRQYGCPNVVKLRSQNGYCNNHESMRSNWNKRPQRAGSTTERGYGHAWRKLREKVLQRDGYLCVNHYAKGEIVEATDVDHIVSKEKGGTDELDNLQSLCAQCHQEKTAKEDSKQ
ncbi:HNH endonuclease [Acinetobacter colistiniresistens]|uniref:Putative HNH nuclease YajD n=2 Tax=Acinetobacter colistiniresistens TaxID=280145 RepID=A0A558EXI6_9GAMM|nr:HNH endonuclease [Acinetobacter colistiniresistens]TVT77629.1 HNH endonuclease [Acinetobacter colistiniresistens]